MDNKLVKSDLYW